jgi:hypothetical protein
MAKVTLMGDLRLSVSHHAGNSRSRPEQGLGSSPSKSLPVTYPALTAQSTQQSVLSFHEPDALEPHIAVHLHGEQGHGCQRQITQVWPQPLGKVQLIPYRWNSVNGH